MLVVAMRREPAAVDDLDRIIVTRRPAPILQPRGAGDQRRAAAQKLGDVAERSRIARQNEGKRRLGPDQVRDVLNPGSIRRCGALRQVEVAAQDRLLVFRGERSVLADVGLDQAQLDAGEASADRRREPELAESGDKRKRERGDRRWSEIEAALADAPKRRRRGEYRDRQEREPVQADA